MGTIISKNAIVMRTSISSSMPMSVSAIFFSLNALEGTREQARMVPSTEGQRLPFMRHIGQLAKVTAMT